MTEMFNSTGRIAIRKDVVPRLLFTDGKNYLDFFSIQILCGDKIARTTLFNLLKNLPNMQENCIKYRNRSYYAEDFVTIHLKNIIAENLS